MQEMTIKHGVELYGSIAGVLLSGVLKSTVVQAHFELNKRRRKMDCCGLKRGPPEKTVSWLCHSASSPSINQRKLKTFRPISLITVRHPCVRPWHEKADRLAGKAHPTGRI